MRQAIEKRRVQIGKTMRVEEVKALLNPKWLEALEKNDKLQPCCQRTDSYKVSFYDTDGDVGNGADLVIFECEDCGRRHYRLAAAAGRP